MRRPSEIFRADRGAVAAILAILAVPLVGFLGLATDAARAYLVEAKLSQALDAAALAGGRVMYETYRDSDVQAFFRANYPDGYMGATVGTPKIQTDAAQETLTVSVDASVKTTFMRVLGKESMQVGAQSVVHRSARGMELALVMDNTGSMLSGGKIDAMKDGASELIQILYGDRNTIPNVWVSLVPYTSAVNVGPTRTGWLTGYSAQSYKASPQGWKGCVEERYATGQDVTDTPPAQAPFKPFLYPSATDNAYPPVDESAATNTTGNNGKGPNLGCGPAITPMLTNKDAVLGAIAKMAPWHRGGTMTNIGLAWGWRILSPRWRGLWSNAAPTLPLDYGSPYMDKIAVILTDGENQFHDEPPAGPQGSDYTASGRLGWAWLGTTSQSTATVRVDQRMSQICASMKQTGIILYTITFQVAKESTRTLFRDCASNPANYFDSPSNEALRSAFRQIGTTLSNLRLAQ